MADSNQNIVTFRLTWTLTVSWNTVTVSNDIYRNTVIDAENASITLKNENWTAFELVKWTITGWVLTTSLRWLTEDQTLTEDVNNKKEWRPWTIGFITSFASDMLDIDADWETVTIKNDITFTWDNTHNWTETFTNIDFTWTTTAWLKVKSLTTTQREALTPENWMIVYDSTIWEHYQYIAWAWSAIASWSTQPNASTTVAWKVELATSAESIAWTDTWWTWASLSVLPSDIAKNTQSGAFVYALSSDISDTYTANLTPTLTSYTTWMKVVVKFTTANTWACTLNIDWLWAKPIKTKDWNDPQTGVIRALWIFEFIYDWTNFVIQSEDFATSVNKWLVEKSTNLEVVTWTDEERYINPKQAYETYNNIFYWTTNTAYDSWSLWYIALSYFNASSYATAKQVTANYSGRFTIWVNCTVESSNLNQTSLRLYVNWVLQEQKDWTYISSWTFNTTFSNFVIIKWDVIRLDVKVIQSQFANNNERVNVSTFNFKYNTITNQTLFS